MSKPVITTKQHRLRQWQHLGLALAALLGLMGLVLWVTHQRQPAPSSKGTTTPYHFTDPAAGLSDRGYLIEQAQEQLKIQATATKQLTDEVNALKTAANQAALSQQLTVKALQQQVTDLSQQLAKKRAVSSATVTQHPQNIGHQGKGHPNGAYQDYFQSAAGQAVSGQSSWPGTMSTVTDIADTHVTLTNPQPKRVKTVNNYVPANTFALAVVIEGADASASVMGQSNPTPMLFRLIGNGTLPNGYKAHLKGCVVSGAVVGDISSERGQIRLERLSCEKPNGHTLDIKVDGTVSGPGGKDGIRGVPVSREGKLLWQAGVAGALSGLSDGLSQTYTTASISPLGATHTVNHGAVFRYGLARGGEKGLNKLSDYMIRRADQYHPVIQLNAGTVVNVEFLKGFWWQDTQEETHLKHAGPEDSPMDELNENLPPHEPATTKARWLNEWSSHPTTPPSHQQAALKAAAFARAQHFFQQRGESHDTG